MVLNEAAWGLGNSLLTVILGYTDNSVEMLAANAVMGNLNRLLLVVCFGLGAATAVLVGKAIGEGQKHQDVLELSQELLRFSTLIGAGIAVLSLLLIPTLFVPVLFPMFKLHGNPSPSPRRWRSPPLPEFPSTPTPSPPSPAFCGPAGTWPMPRRWISCPNG